MYFFESTKIMELNEKNYQQSMESKHFSGVCNEQEVVLKWKTASEKNVSHFDILQLSENQLWDKIGEVAAVGNSSTTNEYSFATRLNNGVQYYNLRSVDFDGREELFYLISVVCAFQNDEWLVYPNPAKHQLIIQLSSEEEMKDGIQLIDPSGKLVLQNEISVAQGANIFQVNLSDLAQGIYLVRLRNSPTKPVIKLVKED